MKDAVVLALLTLVSSVTPLPLMGLIGGGGLGGLTGGLGGLTGGLGLGQIAGPLSIGQLIKGLLGPGACARDDIYIAIDVSPRANANSATPDVAPVLKNFVTRAARAGAEVHVFKVSRGLTVLPDGRIAFASNPTPAEVLFNILREATQKIPAEAVNPRLIIIITDENGAAESPDTEIGMRIIKLANSIKSSGVEIRVVQRVNGNGTLDELLPNVATTVDDPTSLTLPAPLLKKGLNVDILSSVLETVFNIVCQLLEVLDGLGL